MNKFHRQTALFIASFAAVMAAFIFLAVVASSLFIRPVAAQQPNTATKENFCQSIIQIHETLDEKLKDIPHTSKILRGLPAKRFVKVFNEYGDNTNIKADAVGLYVVITQPDHILVTFELNHCVSDKLMMPLALYVELIRQSENQTGEGA